MKDPNYHGLDEIDVQILKFLQRNARISNADIARELDMAPSAVLERIRKLELRGVVLGYEARIAPKAVDLGLTAFIFIRTKERGWASTTAEKVSQITGVQEVHNLAGEDCYLVKLRVRDTEELARILHEEIGAIDSIASTRTTIVLGTAKESAQLPLNHLGGKRSIEGRKPS